jgi:hypothetical protein
MFYRKGEAMSQTATSVVQAPGVAQEIGTGQRTIVTISIKGGKIDVAPEPFSISKSKQQEVLWVTDPKNLQFTVEFKKGDSPFYNVQFNNEFPASGLVRRVVLHDPQRKYAYAVRVEGYEPLDPTGVVTK